jgi:polar amino acid transport system permease protein
MRELGPNEIFFIIFSVRWTFLLAAIALVGSAIGGLIIALALTSGKRIFAWPALAIVKVFQGTPLLMQLFLAFFVPSLFGINIDPLAAAALGLSLNGSAFLGDIWRGCIETVPRGQSEAATALSLNYFTRTFEVVLPQAFRIAIPPTIGYLVQLIKGTSLAAIIGFVEITRAGQIINNMTFTPFAIFGLVGAIYFIICWPLSLYASYMEKKLLVAR